MEKSPLISDERARGEPPPRSGQKEIWDRQRGLSLRVSAGGARSWCVHYKVANGAPGKRGRPLKTKGRRMTLGPVEEISADEARIRAIEIRRQAREGVDPVTKTVAERENTVRAVAKRLVADAKLSIKSWNRIDSVLRDYVLPTLGDRAVSSISRADVENLLDDLKAKHSVSVAREARKHLGKLLNFAVRRQLIPANPIRGEAMPELAPKRRERVLTDAELKAVWNTAPSLGELRGAAVRLIVLTGQRKNEILEARWDEIDERNRTLVIPPERHKSKRGHVVPLSDAAWAIVAKLPRKEDTELLFPSTDGGEGAVWLGQKVIAALREAAPDPGNKQPFHIHDLRRTCKTRLAALGVAPDVREAVQGHVKSGMDRTYNLWDYMTERREALEAYAAHVLEVAK